MILFLGQNASIHGQNVAVDAALSTNLQAVIDSIRLAKNIAGISAAVNFGGDDVWLGTSGWSDPIIKDTIRSDMLLGIASITKVYISALILRLVEEGELTLDDSLHKWLPPIKHVDSSTSIRQLLNHTSGIYNIFGPGILFPEDGVYTPEVLESNLKPPLFKPGSEWSYSNTNYILLGMIIQTVTQSEISTELRKRFFIPLSLTSSFLWPEEAIKGDVAPAWGFDSGNFVLSSSQGLYSYKIWWTAAGILSTAEDLAGWTRNLFGGDILSEGSLSEMLTFEILTNDYASGYGLGCEKLSLFGMELWGHSGSIAGYNSIAMYSPDLDASIVVLLNTDSGAAFLDLVMALLDVLIDDQVTDVYDFVESDSKRFHLEQNFPNPFDHQTVIQYSLSTHADVELSIYDALGSKVNTLLPRQNQVVGDYQIMFQGKNEHGMDLFPGVYLYRLESAGVVTTKRMLLMR